MSYRGPFIWTASQQSLVGFTLTCQWCGRKTDFIGSQMGNYDLGWACVDCMRDGAPPCCGDPGDCAEDCGAA